MEEVIGQLAPGGTLRAGINLGNPLLVTGATPAGEPAGVAPDMAREIADSLGVQIAYVTYASPGELADALERDAWDIGLIAAEPARAESIAFTRAYVEIEATYLVPDGSPIRSIADVDRPGTRIAVSGRSAYDLFLTRNLQHAELRRANGIAGSADLFVDERLEALAGLRPALNEQIGKMPGARILDGRFTAVQQSIGTKPGNTAATAYLEEFVAAAKSSGLIARLIDRHGVTGRLQVAE